MASNILGFNLTNTIFTVDSVDVQEVARFGTCNDIASVRLYAASASNAGYIASTGVLSPGANAELQDFSLQATNQAYPSIYVEGSTGNIGIGTTVPTHGFTINRDLYTSVIQCQNLFTDTISSSNVPKVVDFSSNEIINVTSAQFLRDVYIGGSLTHVMGNMQRIQVHDGKTFAQSGTHQYGYIVSWDPDVATINDTIEVILTMTIHLSVPAHHSCTLIINPITGLDIIADQRSLISDIVGKTRIYMTHEGNERVRVYYEWTCLEEIYKASIKMDVFAPVTFGNLTFDTIWS
jgi:hypothetical protein